MSPEALKKFSDTLTKTFREKVLANRKLYVVKYMHFSTENRSGAKKNSFINDERRYYPIVVPNTVSPDRKCQSSEVHREYGQGKGGQVFRQSKVQKNDGYNED